MSRFDQLGQVPPAVQAALWVISRQGAAVSVKNVAETLRAAGSRDDIGTSLVTVGHLGGAADETLLATNGITHVISSDAGDTETVTCAGFTIADGRFTAVTQTCVLNGQTPVALATPLARTTSIINVSATTLAGRVFSYEGGTTTGGIPDDSAEVHNEILAGDQRSAKCAGSIADNTFFIITVLRITVLQKTTGTVDFDFDVKLRNGVFQRVTSFSVSTLGTSTFQAPLDPCQILPPNADFRIRAKAKSGSGFHALAGVDGYIAGPY